MQGKFHFDLKEIMKMATLDRKNFMVCCANGAGSSLMMKMTLDKVLKKLGVTPAKVHHCALSEGKSSAASYDVVFCAKNFVNMFDAAAAKGTKVLGLKNLLSVAEMEQALKDAGLVD